MAKTSVVAIKYKNSDSVEIQGKESKIQPYLNKGYEVRVNRDGYWLLSRTAKINVTLSRNEDTATFNMRQDILNHYGRKKMNQNLFNKFKQDIESGVICLTLISPESYSFV